MRSHRSRSRIGTGLTRFAVLMGILLGAAVGGAGIEPAMAVAVTASQSDPSTESSIVTLRTEERQVDRGDQLRVTGDGWPANAMVQVEICGQEAVDGSSDCDVRTSRSVATFADGHLAMDLLVTAPPSPCPCVVRAFVAGTAATAQVPIEIRGHPIEEVTAPPETRAERAVDVESVEIETVGSGLWSRRRKALVTVVNRGTVEVRDVSVRVRWGGERPDRPVAIDPIASLEPGEETVLSAEFELDPFTFGRFHVRAEPLGLEGEAATGETVAPIFELLIAASVVLLIVVLVWFRFRRRRRGPAGDASAAGAGDESEDADHSSDADEAAAPVSADEVETAAHVSGSVSGPFPDTEPAPDRRHRIPAGPGWTGARTVAGVMTIGILLLTGCSRGKSDTGSAPDSLCGAIESADPGHRIGGESLRELVESVGILAEIDDAPETLEPAVTTIAEAWRANPDAHRFAELELGDEGYGAAHEAAYRLRFTPGLREAAALIERHGIDECALLPSGKLELPEHLGADWGDSEVTLSEEPFPEIEFDFGAGGRPDLQMPEFTIPEIGFEIDRGRYSVERFEPRAPDLSGREGSTGR